MRYGITKSITTFQGFIDISQREYKEIKLARENLFQALFIEEKFDVIIENYIDFEKELLSSGARHMLFKKYDYDWMHSEINFINRCAVNLLTTCRLYLDQSKHHIGNIYGKNSDKVNKFTFETEYRYDNYLGYRTMEALRNYVQHRGFPIHSGTFDIKFVDKESTSNVLFAFTPYILVSELDKDPKFKKSILAELKTMGEKVDIKPLIREYVECIGLIQEKIRQNMKDDLEVWEDILNQTINMFRNEFGSEESLMGLMIVAETDENTYSDTTSIFTEFIDRRKELVRKNRSYENLTARYVTNEIISPAG